MKSQKLKPCHQLLKSIAALAVALLVMLLVRTVVVTVCSVEGDAWQPVFVNGDRVMVNRWSYGLRVGGSGMLSYNRLWRKPVMRGDIVAVNDPIDSLLAVDERRVLFLRCKHVPGDNVSQGGKTYQVPGRYSCADMDYYLMEPISSPEGGKPLRQKSPHGEIWRGLGGLSLIPEDHIIGRAFLIIYSHDPNQPLWDGWRSDRLFLIP